MNASYDIAAKNTARIASFQRAEAATGLLVGIGSITVALPGTVARIPSTSALLLLPIVVLLAYGALILARRPSRGDAVTPLQPDERRLVRRRTITWGVATLVASALPPEWIWPLFISGWITLAYAVRQIQRHRRP